MVRTWTRAAAAASVMETQSSIDVGGRGRGGRAGLDAGQRDFAFAFFAEAGEATWFVVFSAASFRA